MVITNNNNNNNNNNSPTEIRRKQGTQKLQTHYVPNKTLTGILARRICTRVGEHNLMSNRAERCHPGSKECKDQLTIREATYEECRKRRKN
jgi:hypothetical protein